MPGTGSGTTNAPFRLFRLNEHKPKLGDPVCLRRLHRRTFDDLPEVFSRRMFIIVEVSANPMTTIGAK